MLNSPSSSSPSQSPPSFAQKVFHLLQTRALQQPLPDGFIHCPFNSQHHIPSALIVNHLVEAHRDDALSTIPSAMYSRGTLDRRTTFLTSFFSKYTDKRNGNKSSFTQIKYDDIDDDIDDDDDDDVDYTEGSCTKERTRNKKRHKYTDMSSSSEESENYYQMQETEKVKKRDYKHNKRHHTESIHQTEYSLCNNEHEHKPIANGSRNYILSSSSSSSSEVVLEKGEEIQYNNTTSVNVIDATNSRAMQEKKLATPQYTNNEQTNYVQSLTPKVTSSPSSAALRSQTIEEQWHSKVVVLTRSTKPRGHSILEQEEQQSKVHFRFDREDDMKHLWRLLKSHSVEPVNMVSVDTWRLLIVCSSPEDKVKVMDCLTHNDWLIKNNITLM